MLKIVIGCLIIVGFPTYGQVQDKEQIISVVDQLFAGMRQGDSVLVRQAFDSSAQLHTIGENGLHTTPLKQFLIAVGTPHDEVWDERVTEYEVRVDGPLATVWTPYRFYRGETFSHCGVNAFQLVRSKDEWKILQITDTRREEGCKEGDSSGK